MYEIEIGTKSGFKDVRGEQILSEVVGLGIKEVKKVEYSPLYSIEGNIKSEAAKKIAAELLSDKITEVYKVNLIKSGKIKKGTKVPVIEVWYKKGVTDTVSESVIKAVKDLGIKEDLKVKTGHKYYLYGKLNSKVLDNIATKLLANTLIQEYKIK